MKGDGEAGLINGGTSQSRIDDQMGLNNSNVTSLVAVQCSHSPYSATEARGEYFYLSGHRGGQIIFLEAMQKFSF